MPLLSPFLAGNTTMSWESLIYPLRAGIAKLESHKGAKDERFLYVAGGIYYNVKEKKEVQGQPEVKQGPGGKWRSTFHHLGEKPLTVLAVSTPRTSRGGQHSSRYLG